MNNEFIRCFHQFISPNLSANFFYSLSSWKRRHFLLVQNRLFSQFAPWKRNHNKHLKKNGDLEFEIGKTIWWICNCVFLPDNCVPPSPTMVSNFCGSFWIKSKALASWHAWEISSSVASGLAYFIFSLIEQSNKTGSCPTIPMWSLNHPTFNCLISVPSISTLPSKVIYFNGIVIWSDT